VPSIQSTIIEILQDNKARDITDTVVSMVFKESLLTGKTTWELVLFADNLEAEEPLMFAKDTISLRITVTRNSIEQTTGWRILTVLSSSVFYQGSTSAVRIKGSDYSAILKTEPRWRAFNNVNAVEIFSEIASENGLIFPSEAISTIGTWLPLGETDWNFLRSVTEEIVMTAGQRHAWLFINNRTMELKTIGYSERPIRSFSIGGGDDRASNMKLSYNDEVKSFRSVGFDSRTKSAISHEPPEEVLPILAGRKVNSKTARSVFSRSPLDSALTVGDESTLDWADITSKHFPFQVSLVGDVGIRLGNLIDVTAVDPTGESSSLNGKYPVYEIVHLYKARAEKEDDTDVDLSTHIGGFRRTFHYGSDSAEGSNFSNIKSRDDYTVFSPQKEDKTVLVSEALEIE